MKLRLPLVVVAAALLGLIAVLATLQYRWLGRISEAERDRRSAALQAQAQAFADDFDRELTRAYLLFQWEPAPEDDSLATRVAGRYERWLAAARFPRLIREVLIIGGDPGAVELQRFDPDVPSLEPAAWPAVLEPLRNAVNGRLPEPGTGATTIIRALPRPLWGEVPALVVPLPTLFMSTPGERGGIRVAPAMSHAVLMLDRDYVAREVLPALADQHFGRTPDAADFRLAVVQGDTSEVVYRSTDDFSPSSDARLDASADVFRVRPQEFGEMVSEIRRLSAVLTAAPGGSGQFVIQLPGAKGEQAAPRQRIEFRELTATMAMPENSAAGGRATVVAEAATAVTTGRASMATPSWRLLVQHRAGSLEAAIDATRRRNLAISSGILGLLGTSVGFLIVSTRRAQRLARQQMEFVAAVSHELRTPLAVIRSAGDNLAEGVVGDERQVRTYGDLVRREGRRLTEMVEQILEFAGIDSGQRAFVLRPVSLAHVVDDVVEASRTLIEERRLTAEVEVPREVPPVLADEGAIRRVIQNLVGNAIKYGADGRVVRVTAAASGREVRLTVADKGIGIAASEQERIFEPFYRAPDVVAAQIQGAGLGLSLVKRIVEAHGGRIAVRSAPGTGSEFTVWLPAATGEPARAVTTVDAPGAAGHRSHA